MNPVSRVQKRGVGGQNGVVVAPLAVQPRPNNVVPVQLVINPYVYSRRPTGIEGG